MRLYGKQALIFQANVCFFFLPDISSFPVPPQPTSAAAADAVGAIYFATTATFNNRERAGNFNKKNLNYQ